MAMRWWPRSIRWQMLAGLVLLEALSIILFAVLLISQRTNAVYLRARFRLAHQATSVALQATEALRRQQPEWMGLSVRMMGEAPSVALVKVTDPAGNVLFVSHGTTAEATLDAIERAQLLALKGAEAKVFDRGGDRWEGAKPVYLGTELRGIAWVETDRGWDHQELNAIRRGTVIFGSIWIVASVLLVLGMAGSITRPLEILHRGTRSLMNAPESTGSFPLPVTFHNEIGDLIEAFNRMVASIQEQRAGLRDALSLLDSMLANAPIGLAFFDRSCRFVRVNHVFAEMTGVALSSHLGRTLPEMVAQPVAGDLEEIVLRVFSQGEPVRNLELSGMDASSKLPWTWLVSVYPVRTSPDQMRWVGVIVLDASERKRSEEALRKSEKLAATGRLAASIAHEINNPLESITNLHYLMRNFCALEGPALDYLEKAEHEVQRISEITQQTLRFYRQSTLPARARLSELLDSVLALYQGRLNAMHVEVEREYDSEMDLFCFAGEVRQVFANLVGNALDAFTTGGRLVVRARRSRNWAQPEQTGVRFTVADTGAGMEPAVRDRVFEAFFTTKEVTGTGLGLWVSHEIIVKHRGLVHVRSRVAQSGKSSGTVFQVFLPDEPAVSLAASQIAAAAI